jgi:hypothetical protein
MIRLTVLYNLPPDADEATFLAWRLGEHQASNLSMPGVVQGDFARIAAGWPEDATPPYRFMTTVDWPDWESFHAGFYASQAQAKLKEDVKKIRDALFLVSEILVSEQALEMKRKDTPA